MPLGLVRAAGVGAGGALSAGAGLLAGCVGCSTGAEDELL